MPWRQTRGCRHSLCPARAVRDGFCERHARDHDRQYRQERGTFAQRGYGADSGWPQIRARVLTEAGIPRELWSDYIIHHEPKFNPDVDPNHEHYTLRPVTRGEHNKLTAHEGGAPNRRRQNSANTDPVIG